VGLVEDGSAKFSIATHRLMQVTAGRQLLAVASGLALIVHVIPNDLTTIVSVENGNRLLCDVILASMPASLIASPVAEQRALCQKKWPGWWSNLAIF
jgi:hypothetical protein